MLDAVLHKIIIFLDAVLGKSKCFVGRVLHKIIILPDAVLHKSKPENYHFLNFLWDVVVHQVIFSDTILHK
ncbi:MAG: hypothetical protein MJE68_07605, partial [Proteobacteria bacterium]|nr:hypothetical protein [Pseudomonadota bacterium]